MSEQAVYVIINEWWPVGHPSTITSAEYLDPMGLTEIVDSRYFWTESEAHDHLSDIAESYGVSIDPEECSIRVPFEGTDGQDYYIMELWNNG